MKGSSPSRSNSPRRKGGGATLLGIVPARKGSKAIPGKNKSPIAGRPLIDYTVKILERAPRVARSTSGNVGRCLVHITADPQSRPLVGRSSIAKMKPGAFLVNTARGMIVDGAAAADALTSRRLAGVAVDVLEGEEHRPIDGDH